MQNKTIFFVSKKIFYLCMLLLFLAGSTSAQSSPCSDKEKTCFPHWVFDDSLYVGVSDPFLTFERAREQALGRALFLYTIRNGGISILESSEFYQIEDIGIRDVARGKIVQTILFSAQLKNVSCSVERQWISDNGEVFVDVRVAKSCKESSAFEFAAVLKRNVLDDPIPSKATKDIDYTMYVKSNSSEYNEIFWTKKNEDISCIWKDSSMDYTKEYLFYGKDCSEQSKPSSFVLSHGFWATEFDSFVESLFAYTKKDMEVKSVQTVCFDRVEELVSIDAKEVLVCVWKHGGVKENKLLIDWTIAEKNDLKR